ncbi:MAG TPA: succinate dehydrogenase assembly factor 2 [Casimicrobiaceae bacterium]|jgi:antitoxin CptB
MSNAACPGEPASLAAAPVDARRLARIRWRARRGLLENDLVLARFLDRRGADLTEAEVAALDRLLDLPDNELWDVICGRVQADAALQPLVHQLSES